MREWYADLMDDGIINRDHKIDAWSNISDADIKLKKDEEKGSIEDRIKKLKKKIEKQTKEQADVKEKVRQLLGAITGKVTPDISNHLPAYLQIAVLGRPPKPEEMELFVNKFKAFGLEFQKTCEDFNFQQGIVRDYDLSLKEIKALLEKYEDQQRKSAFGTEEEKKEGGPKQTLPSHQFQPEVVHPMPGPIGGAKASSKDDLEKNRKHYAKVVAKNNQLEAELKKLKAEVEALNKQEQEIEAKRKQAEGGDQDNNF